MNIDELLKKRLLFFFASFLFIVIVTMSSSYAIMNSDVDKGKVINNGNLKIIYPDGDEIVENCGYPLSYQQGNAISPSNIIKIYNESDRKTSFGLYIRVKNDVENSLDINKIYYSINDGDPVILGKIDDFMVFSADIANNEEYVLDIKVWAASELVNNDDQGKEINLVYEVREV